MSPKVLNLIRQTLEANGEAVFSREEIAAWPAGDFDEALREGLLEKAAPADEVVCPGCEEACLEDVEFLYGEKPEDTRAYVVCGKRDDISRVWIPLESLDRWAVNRNRVDLLARPEHAGGPTDTEARLQELRAAFDAAIRRLEAIPDSELSTSGEPFVRECADALLAFSEWFGQQTPDDLAIHGSAYRVEYALRGLSGVMDWIALRWSVPFSEQLEGELAALVSEAESFDKSVVKAFTVKRTANELHLQRKLLPDRTYSRLESGIARVSSLADRIAGRLCRVGVWAEQEHHRKTMTAAPVNLNRALLAGEADGELPRTLPDFIRKHCVALKDPTRARQLADFILREARRKPKPKLTLPPTTNRAKGNRKKYFRPCQLRDRWAVYMDVVPNLPPLKPLK